METPRTWTMVLRCYVCGGKFKLFDLELDRLLALVPMIPCPHCSAQPHIAAGSYEGEKTRLHRILFFRESVSEEVEEIYRKREQCDTWHMSPDCSHWPTTDFIELENFPPAGPLCNECRASKVPSAF